MSLMKCPECGNEISDLAEKCPNCGFPIGFNSEGAVPNNTVNQANNSPYNNPYQSQPYAQPVKAYTPNQKNSVLGILALIFSILGCTFIVGAVLAIIDLVKKDGKKKVCAIIALVICGFWLLVGIIGSSNSDTKNEEVKSVTKIEDTKETSNKEVTEETKNESNTEEDSEDNSDIQSEKADLKTTFYVGDVIETEDFIISYLTAEEYKTDNQFMQPKDGYTYYKIGFEFENISDTDKYVSSWDFECYSDGYSSEQTYFDEESLDATLSGGKKTKGYIFFEVPKNSESVVLEYETNYWTQDKIEFVVK